MSVPLNFEAAALLALQQALLFYALRIPIALKLTETTCLAARSSGPVFSTTRRPKPVGAGPQYRGTIRTAFTSGPAALLRPRHGSIAFSAVCCAGRHCGGRRGRSC